MFKQKLGSATIIACVASLAISGCAQLEGLKQKLPSIPSGETSADRADRLTASRANQVLRNVCFKNMFQSLPLSVAAEASGAVSVASPGSRPSPLPESVWSYRDTPFLVFWGPKEAIGCSVGVFSGDLDAALLGMTNSLREEFGRRGSDAPNPFINLPVRTHAQVRAKEVGPISVKYEGRTYSLRITAQTLKDPVSDVLPGFVLALRPLS